MKTTEEKARIYATNGMHPCDEVPLSVLMAQRSRTPYQVEQAYIAGAKEALAGQWRKCEDELPDEMQRVIVGTDKGITLTGFWREEDGWELNTMYPTAYGKVVAWLPLPKFNP